MIQYSGRRDPRFVAVHRGGLLDEATHRLLASWSAECAEHVLPLFADTYPDDDRPRRAIETARAWSRGEVTVRQAREAAYAAHAAAREATDLAAREVARAAGHAVATAHMADHELGGAFFAIKSVRAASPAAEAIEAGERECRWQRDRLPEAIRDLVLSDQQMRSSKFQSLFEC
jgi:predicted NBD/HSP70 family sugar kinase